MKLWILFNFVLAGSLPVEMWHLGFGVWAFWASRWAPLPPSQQRWDPGSLQMAGGFSFVSPLVLLPLLGKSGKPALTNLLPLNGVVSSVPCWVPGNQGGGCEELTSALLLQDGWKLHSVGIY